MRVHPSALQLPRCVHVRLPVPHQEQQLRGRGGLGVPVQGYPGGAFCATLCLSLRGDRAVIVLVIAGPPLGPAVVAVTAAGEALLRDLAVGSTVEAAVGGGVRRGGPSLCKVGVESLEGGIQARLCGTRCGVSLGHRGEPAVEGLVGFVRRRCYRETLLRLAFLQYDERNLRVQSNTRATAAVVVGERDFQCLRLVYGSERTHRGCHVITRRCRFCFWRVLVMCESAKDVCVEGGVEGGVKNAAGDAGDVIWDGQLPVSMFAYYG